ncbi:MAG: hypothetical protein QW609_04235 [Candidatus Aenigmatarchaeota archaeon]
MDISSLKGKPFCEICMRNCVEKNMNSYWGNVGEYVCEKCKRKVCNIHFNKTLKLCLDCKQSTV